MRFKMQITNINFKKFLALYQQAKNSGATEIRLPIKQAEDLVLELSLLMSDKVVNDSEKTESSSGSQIDLSNISLSGGGFKKD